MLCLLLLSFSCCELNALLTPEYGFVLDERYWCLASSCWLLLLLLLSNVTFFFLLGPVLLGSYLVSFIGSFSKAVNVLGSLVGIFLVDLGRVCDGDWLVAWKWEEGICLCSELVSRWVNGFGIFERFLTLYLFASAICFWSNLSFSVGWCFDGCCWNVIWSFNVGSVEGLWLSWVLVSLDVIWSINDGKVVMGWSFSLLWAWEVLFSFKFSRFCEVSSSLYEVLLLFNLSLSLLSLLVLLSLSSFWFVCSSCDCSLFGSSMSMSKLPNLLSLLTLLLVLSLLLFRSSVLFPSFIIELSLTLLSSSFIWESLSELVLLFISWSSWLSVIPSNLFFFLLSLDILSLFFVLFPFLLAFLSFFGLSLWVALLICLSFLSVSFLTLSLLGLSLYCFLFRLFLSASFTSFSFLLFLFLLEGSFLCVSVGSVLYAFLFTVRDLAGFIVLIFVSLFLGSFVFLLLEGCSLVLYVFLLFS